MIPALAMTAAQLSALIFIALLIVAGIVVMGLTPNDILNPRPDHESDNPDGADTLYKGMVTILFIGLVGIVVTVCLY